MIDVIAAGLSTSGRNRSENEDAHVIVSPPDPVARERKGHLIAVADGLGGHEAGQVASATAVHAVAEAYFAPTSPSRVEPALQHAIQVANLKVHEAARGVPSSRSMQTTLACLVIAGASAYVANVGDSRVYLARHEQFTQLTNDHSEAAELVRLRLARPDALANHPRRNVLTRTVGSQMILRPDFRRLPIEAGDVFVLCSDGLWSEVTDEELAAASRLASVDEACQQLIDLQLNRDSLDNATVVMVKVRALDPVAAEGEGWISTLVNRFVGPRDGRPATENRRGNR
jgi:protein phosphatase